VLAVEGDVDALVEERGEVDPPRYLPASMRTPGWPRHAPERAAWPFAQHRFERIRGISPSSIV